MRTFIVLVVVVLYAGSVWAFSMDEQNLSYGIGVHIARSIDANQRSLIDPAATARGFVDGISSRELKYTERDIRSLSSKYAASTDLQAHNNLSEVNRDILSYTIGASIGASIVRSMFLGQQALDFNYVARGLGDGLRGSATEIPEQQIEQLFFDRSQTLRDVNSPKNK
jgi:hypothetical protein